MTLCIVNDKFGSIYELRTTSTKLNNNNHIYKKNECKINKLLEIPKELEIEKKRDKNKTKDV